MRSSRSLIASSRFSSSLFFGVLALLALGAGFGVLVAEIPDLLLRPVGQCLNACLLFLLIILSLRSAALWPPGPGPRSPPGIPGPAALRVKRLLLWLCWTTIKLALLGRHDCCSASSTVLREHPPSRVRRAWYAVAMSSLSRQVTVRQLRWTIYPKVVAGCPQVLRGVRVSLAGVIPTQDRPPLLGSSIVKTRPRNPLAARL